MEEHNPTNVQNVINNKLLNNSTSTENRIVTPIDEISGKEEEVEQDTEDDIEEDEDVVKKMEELMKENQILRRHLFASEKEKRDILSRSKSKPSQNSQRLVTGGKETKIASLGELDKYRRRMFTPTSKKDLEYMLDGKVKIITYKQLDDYKTIEDLLDPYQSVIILYPNHSDPEIGHWVTIFKMPGADNMMIEYFDSYGAYIDHPIDEFNKESKYLHEPQRIEPKLIDLLIDSPYKNKVEWNEFPFQSDEVATDTCGLWCVIRLKNNVLNENAFKKTFYDMPEAMGILPDLLVSSLIVDMFPEMTTRE